MLTLYDVLRHLAVHGPARNPAEAEAFTEAIDAAEAEAFTEAIDAAEAEATAPQSRQPGGLPAYPVKKESGA